MGALFNFIYRIGRFALQILYEKHSFTFDGFLLFAVGNVGLLHCIRTSRSPLDVVENNIFSTPYRMERNYEEIYDK